MSKRIRTLLLALGFVLTTGAHSQQLSGLNLIAKIDLHERPDIFRLFSGSDEDHGRRAPLFAVAAVPDGNLICLVAMQSGPWHLVQVRNWTAKKPVVEHLNLPGYGADTSLGAFSITPEMLITRDGKYLVAVAPDPWPQGTDATVTVIDLQTFRLIATRRASQLGLIGEWQLGPEDLLEVHGLYPNRSEPLGREEWLAILSVPDFHVIDRCDYAVAFNPPNSEPPLRAELHGKPSSMCVREAQNQLTHQADPGELLELSVMFHPNCSIEATTPDRHYAVGTCRDCRQTLFGVSCKSEKSEVYSSDSNKTIARLIHAPHKLTRNVITQFQGKLYLLSIESAQTLTVYQFEGSTERVSNVSGQPK